MSAESDVIINLASGPADIAAVSALFREFAASLPIDLGPQGFEDELAALPGAYAPPRGALLLAKRGDEALGCIAVKPLAPPAIGEIKRLYVRPAGRGLGVGKALVAAIMTAAERIGFEELKLDTLPHLTAAIGLYRAVGFSTIAPYGSHPYPGLVCLGRKLRGWGRLPDDTE
jgi:ribosomal protein S18 acetylase RimI-like enzyme